MSSKTTIRPSAGLIIIGTLMIASLTLVPWWWDIADGSSMCPHWYPAVLCPEWMIKGVKIAVIAVWAGLLAPAAAAHCIPGLISIELTNEGIRYRCYTTGFRPVAIPRKDIAWCTVSKTAKKSSACVVLALRARPEYPRLSTNHGLNKQEVEYIGKADRAIPEPVIEHAHFIALPRIVKATTLKKLIAKQFPEVSHTISTPRRVNQKDIMKLLTSLITDSIIERL